MNQIAIAEQMESIQSQILLLLRNLKVAQQTNMERYPEYYAQLVAEILEKAESTACSIRHIMYNAGIKKSEIMAQSSRVLGIRVVQDQNWLKIILPVLLQRRRRNMTAEYLSDPLYYALGEYFLLHSDFQKYERAVICFRHVYDEKLPERKIRDYDNVEEKPILDTISLFTLIDDTSKLCDVYNTFAYGDSDRTEIFVMEPDRFLPWLKTYQTSQKQMSEKP